MRIHYMQAVTAALLALFTALPMPAAAQQEEVVTVELDVFSGRPNPRMTLDRAEWAATLGKLQALCARAGASTERPAAYPESFLGYRGLMVSQGNTADEAAPAVVLSRGSVRLSKQNAPPVCQDKLRAARGDLYLSDSASEAESYLLQLALQKGVIPEGLYLTLRKTLETGR